jgi:hypothetical protein
MIGDDVQPTQEGDGPEEEGGSGLYYEPAQEGDGPGEEGGSGLYYEPKPEEDQGD